MLAGIFGFAVIPLGVMGFWATQGAARSGRTLLRSQLDAQLAVVAGDVARVWQRQRSELAMLAENDPVRQLLLGDSLDSRVPADVQQAFEQMSGYDLVVIFDLRRRRRVSLGGNDGSVRDVNARPQYTDRSVTVHVPVIDIVTSDTIGDIEAQLQIATLVPSIARPPSREGPLLAIRALGGAEVRSAELDAAVFTSERTLWAQERWTTVQRTLDEPPLTLSLAGALSPYEAPFRRTARTSVVVLLMIGMVVVAGVAVLTRRLTRHVEREFAQREALAAVGEFASELAHEVRNPLTAIRLDVQRAEEMIDDAPSLRTVLPRVLSQIDRVDRAVSGALRVARGGTLEPKPVSLRHVIDGALRSAGPEFARREAKLHVSLTDEPSLLVSGDALALEQLFLNLMINAAQALRGGGKISLTATRIKDTVQICIHDTGVGMNATQLAAMDAPYQSSKRDGTGLGVKIARRIVRSHGGSLAFASASGQGTTATVVLPGAI